MAAEEVPFTEARARLADLVGQVGYGGARVVLTRHGRPAAALVPIADLERLEALDEQPLEQVIALRHGSFGTAPSTPAGPSRRHDIAARRDPDQDPT